MISTSKSILKYIATFVWVLGGIILFLKSYSLLKQALKISSDYFAIIIVLIISFIVGLIKKKYIMSPFCIKNLYRIDGLDKPKIYEFYTLKFLFFLTLMILTGAFLSRISAGNYYALLSVGALDLALSTALLMSSVHFFKRE